MLPRRDIIFNSKLLDKFEYFVHLTIHDDLKSITENVQSEIDLVGILVFTIQCIQYVFFKNNFLE